ncbi:hypothetical protein SNEBB_003744 [Seison nebaliae]|nr:hypothetical protein SNEBB_003744 [Seison nebaliae]
MKSIEENEEENFKKQLDEEFFNFFQIQHELDEKRLMKIGPTSPIPEDQHRHFSFRSQDMIDERLTIFYEPLIEEIDRRRKENELKRQQCQLELPKMSKTNSIISNLNKPIFRLNHTARQHFEHLVSISESFRSQRKRHESSSIQWSNNQTTLHTQQSNNIDEERMAMLEINKRKRFNKWRNYVRKKNRNDCEEILPRNFVECLRRILKNYPNKNISFAQFKRMAVKYRFHPQDITTSELHLKKKEKVQLELAKLVQTQGQMNSGEKSMFERIYGKFHLPIFVPLFCLIQICIYAFHAYRYRTRCGIDIQYNSPVPYDSYLIFIPTKRYHVWKYWTYSLVHAGYSHLLLNVLSLLVLGVALEVVNSAWRIALIHSMGVITASMYSYVLQPTKALCGGSAGTYAVVASHFPNLLMNWKELKFVAPYHLTILVVIYVVDISFSVWSAFRGQAMTNGITTSYRAHAIGFICGIFGGVLLVKNRKIRKIEKYFYVISSILLFLILSIGIILNLFNYQFNDLSIHNNSTYIMTNLTSPSLYNRTCLWT